MTAWPSDIIGRLAASDDLHVAPFREDGRTPGTPTWIWSVVVDGELYARAYNGTKSRWYQAAFRQGAGQIKALGQTFAVAFTQTSGGTLDAAIDTAYRRKYAGSQYLPPMIGARACAATMKINPKE